MSWEGCDHPYHWHAGRIQEQQFRKAWKQLGLDTFTSHLIERGLTVNLMDHRRAAEPRERKWSKLELEQVQEGMTEGLLWKAFERSVEEKGQIVHRITYSKKSERLCHDLRELNRRTKLIPTKMESIDEVKNMIQAREYMAVVDLKKFYWSCRIHQAYRKYFKFRHKGVLYQMTAIPFGWRNAWGVLKKLIDSIIRKMGDRGLRVSNWVDDFLLLLGPDLEVAKERLAKAKTLLKDLGFIVNEEKSSRVPTMKLIFRGYEWDTAAGTIGVPSEKVRDIRREARKFAGTASARDIARLVGKIRYVAAATREAIPYIVELEILKKEILQQRMGWDRKFTLSTGAQEEIQHWRNVKKLSPQRIHEVWDASDATMGDGGPYGYGIVKGDEKYAGLWSRAMRQESQNYRELMTWRKQLEILQGKLKNKTSIYQTDSAVAMKYINRVYGKSTKLARLAASTWKMMIRNGCTQKAIRINQQQISEADRLSRLREKGDLELHRATYQKIMENWNLQPTVDAFATRYSRKCKRFYAKSEDNLAEGVDAFNHSWKNEVVYAFPPVRKIWNVLRKATEDKCDLVIVTPKWTKKNWYQELKRVAHRTKTILREAVVKTGSDRTSPSDYTIFDLRKPTSRMHQ